MMLNQSSQTMIDRGGGGGDPSKTVEAGLAGHHA